MDRRAVLAGVGGATFTSIAGCAASREPDANETGENGSGGAETGGTDGPIESIDIDIVDGTRSFVVGYDLDDYATVLVETSNGEIIQEETASPNADEVALGFEEMRGGEYAFMLRRESDTLASATRSYSGPEPALTSVSTSWERNRLMALEASVGNDGDMPSRLDAARVTTVEDRDVLFQVNAFVLPGGLQLLEYDLSNQFLDIEIPGEITTSITVDTGVGVVEDSDVHELEPGTPEFERIEPIWNRGMLTEVEFDIRNTGDIRRDIYVQASTKSNSIETREFVLIPGRTTTSDVIGGISDPLYNDVSDEYPTVELDVVVYSAAGEELISTTLTTSRPEE